MPVAMADGTFDPNIEVTEDDSKEDKENASATTLDF